MRALITVLLILGSYSSYAQANFEKLAGIIKAKSVSPEEYVIQKFKTNDVVLLGERHIVKQNLLFVQRLIPLLYREGIHTIGMEFGAYENQRLMDSLTTAPDFNEKLAEKMMFDYNVTWAYREYVDIARAAWTFNQTLPKSAKPFRILNLSYIYDWEKFTGKRDGETMRAVFSKGTVDKFRADVIEHEVLAKKGKILALVGTPHAYTKYGSPYFLFNGDDFCAFDRSWLGNRLYEKHPGKVFNILLHQSFIKKTGETYQSISPLDGLMEKLMQANRNKPAGFDLINSDIGKLEDTSINSTCYQNFTIGQLFDGYIFLNPLNELEGCTVIEGFVNENNITHALKQFPDPDWHSRITNLQEMIAFIHANARSIREEGNR